MYQDAAVNVDINYCVDWAQHAEAAWIAVEFFAEGGTDVALSLTPGSHDELRVTMDGETIFDKRAEGNIHPELRRVKAMRALLRQRLQAAGVELS